MAKTNLGFSKEIEILFTETSSKDVKKLVKFLKEQGLEEMTRKESFEFISVEFDAEFMFPSWAQIQAALKEKFPQYDYQYTEGEEDEDSEYFKQYESLLIYD